MSILENLQVGKKIPVHEDYKDMVRKIEFWRESVEVSDDYWDTPDVNGNKALKPFTCEQAEDYKFRLQISTPKNYAGSILTKYLSTAFKEKPIRPDIEFYKNVDLLGSSMQDFMENAMKYALTDGVSYVIPDSTSQDNSLTELQKNIIGVRPFLRLIEAEYAVNWSDYLGHLQEILIEMEDIENNTFYVYYDNQYTARIEVNDKGIVTFISEFIPHGYDRIPVVRILPIDTDESFISSAANMQLSVNNLTSLERIEIYKATFTRYFLKGVRLNQDENGNPIPITFGTDRMITTESENASITPLGALPEQAESIRKSIESETNSLFQQYHLSASQIKDMSQAPSGWSLQISRQDFNSICGKIVKTAEKAETEIAILFNQSESLNLESIVYPRSFIEPSEDEDLQRLRDILSLDLDDSIKQIAKDRYINRYLKKS